MANAGSYARPSVGGPDNDGLLDIIVGSNNGLLNRYEQLASTSNTTAGFSAAAPSRLADGTTVLNAGSVSKPLITDYDGDGLLDLFIGNGNGTVYRYEQATSATAPAITAPLPVVLTAFAGQAMATGNCLSWATAQELNSARFVVEASADGSRYATIATLAAAGNSTWLTTYVYVDASDAAQAPGRRYYRLRQEDVDGTVRLARGSPEPRCRRRHGWQQRRQQARGVPQSLRRPPHGSPARLGRAPGHYGNLAHPGRPPGIQRPARPERRAPGPARPARAGRRHLPPVPDYGHR